MTTAQGIPATVLARCDSVTKRFGSGDAAIADVTFDVTRAELMGVAGHAGSGKSTLLRLVAGLIAPTSGAITIEGQPIAASVPPVQTYISYLGQTSDVPDSLTASEALYFTGVLRGMPPGEARTAGRDLLDRCQLADVARKTLHALDPGRRQMLRFATALMGYPHVLVLDEPTAALDLTQRQLAWEILEQVHKQTGMTTILATRDVAGAESHAHRFAFLKQGRLVAIGTPDALNERYGNGPRMDVTLAPGSKLTVDMRRRLGKLGTLSEGDAGAFTLFPNPDVIGTLAKSVPLKQKKSASTGASSSRQLATVDDSWLLDRSALPGTLGRTVEEIFAIVGQTNLAEFWFSPPSLVDVYQRLIVGAPS